MKLVLKTRGEVLSVYRINFFDGDNNLGARDYSGHVRVLGGSEYIWVLYFRGGRIECKKYVYSYMSLHNSCHANFGI